MSKSENRIVYNQIDFTVKAPKFRISFSYTDDKGLSFIREYILRLLKLNPCRPEQVADYFDLSQKETEIALADLENLEFIKYQEDGAIDLSARGRDLFSDGSDVPKLAVLQEKNVDCHMELIAENFLKNKHIDNHNRQSIELLPANEIMADSKNLAARNFQNRFLELKEDDLINLEKGELYKIDDINQFQTKYFRFIQKFSFDSDGNSLDRNNIESIKDTDKLEQAVTSAVEQYKRSDNLRELLTSMRELEDENTLEIIIDGTFNQEQFKQVNQKAEQQKGEYFIGQVYHQEMIETKLKKYFKVLKKQPSQPLKKLYWLAPSDIYWGTQMKVASLLELLKQNIHHTEKKQKNRLYDLRLYLPMESTENRREKNDWQYKFKGFDDILYGFKEGFLNGNTEILILEDHFVTVCYHTKLAKYDVTLPIGFITSNQEKVKAIFRLVQNYLNGTIHNEDEPSDKKDFGKLVSI